MNAPGGGNVNWPDGWAGRYAIQTVDRKFYGIYLVAASEIIPQIRVGGGLIYYFTTEKLTTYVPAAGRAPTRSPPSADSGGQSSFDVAVEVQPVLSFPLRIGVNYSHQAYQKLTGSLNLAAPPPLAPVFPNQATTHVLPYPSVLGVGVSWRVIPDLVLTLGYTWEGYSIYTSDTFVGETTNPSTGQLLSVSVQRQYRNSSLYRIGAGYQLLPALELRAGGLYYDVGRQPRLLQPVPPRREQGRGSLGAGWEVMKNLSIEAAFLYAWFLTLDSVPAPEHHHARQRLLVPRAVQELGLDCQPRRELEVGPADVEVNVHIHDQSTRASPSGRARIRSRVQPSRSAFGKTQRVSGASGVHFACASSAATQSSIHSPAEVGDSSGALMCRTISSCVPPPGAGVASTDWRMSTT